MQASYPSRIPYDQAKHTTSRHHPSTSTSRRLLRPRPHLLIHTCVRTGQIYGQYGKMLPPDVTERLSKCGPSAFCAVVAQACGVAHSDFALGLTRLFLRAGKGAFLEATRVAS